jgi:hypothetical protein
MWLDAEHDRALKILWGTVIKVWCLGIWPFDIRNTKRSWSFKRMTVDGDLDIACPYVV